MSVMWWVLFIGRMLLVLRIVCFMLLVVGIGMVDGLCIVLLMNIVLFGVWLMFIVICGLW